ncbi:hypothetical protein HispidOSU_022622 [Sigmodon hispidus]
MSIRRLFEPSAFHWAWRTAAMKSLPGRQQGVLRWTHSGGHSYRAVIFDMGGVLLPSPGMVAAEWEVQNRIPSGTILKALVRDGERGPWMRFMRGETTREGFLEEFGRLCSEIAKTSVPINSFFSLLTSAPVSEQFPVMTQAISQIRARGLQTAVLTNNFYLSNGKSFLPLDRKQFDVVVESCLEGICKPDPRIYQLCLQRLRLQPSDVIFLDDLGPNLKAAASLGIHTIKVEHPETAVKELEALLGFPLCGGIPNTCPVRKTMEIPKDALEKYLKGLLGIHDCGQASSATARQGGKLTEVMTELAWDFATKEGFRVFKEMPSTKPLVRSYHAWAGSRLQQMPTGVRGYSIGAAASPSQEAKGGLIISPEGLSPQVRKLYGRLLQFMEQKVYPLEPELQRHQASADRWSPSPLIEDLKEKAKAEGLWNLFLPLETDPEKKYGAGLTNVEYAHLCEVMGMSLYASEIFNCSAPDTGNMELLVRYGTEEQKARWLVPLLEGKIRSCFAMTEPQVASSDASNIEASIREEDGSYVINGHKWWISGILDPRCKLCVFIGKTDPQAPRHQQQSMVLVPMDTPGIKVIRPLSVYGLEDAPGGFGEVRFKDVCVPKENIVLGPGRAFEIMQGRMVPGRIHQCMRLIGYSERALALMKTRVMSRTAFGKPLVEHGTILADIARSRVEIEQARLLVLKAAHLMDIAGNKAAALEIAMIKMVAPSMAYQVIDRAIQAFGAAGLGSDYPLAQFFAWARVLRVADGSDEVQQLKVAKMEMKAHSRLQEPAVPKV